MTRPWPVLVASLARSLALAIGALSCADVAHAQTDDRPRPVYRGVVTPARFDVSPALREIKPTEPRARKPRAIRELETGIEGAPGPEDADAIVQRQVGPGLIPAPIISFNGQGNVDNVSRPAPVGDVGPSHYVAMSNLSFTIYDKAGNLLFGPVANNTLWAGFGGACEIENSGDPIVIYDQLADRWILTQMADGGSTHFNCIAVSTTGDPLGTYFRYAFSTGAKFPDYPKYGLWPDALYVSTREFEFGLFRGVGAYAVERAALLAGNPAAQLISFFVPPGPTPYNVGDGLLPSDLDGTTLPPVGSPNFFVGSMDNGGPYGAPQDALSLWKFHADFVTPASSTFTLTATLPVAAFDSIFPCSPPSSCIPQPGNSAKLDILSYMQRPMWRLAYRNFGTHESLVTNQSVEAERNLAGIRWYELREPNGAVNVFQQGTYAPGATDGIHRWMGSVAMDGDGNMALGYSVSSTSVFPGVRYTGRLAGDPLGTMPQGEGTIVDGTGSQVTSSSWGDYTSMNVDPIDDCTFWHVNEWVPTTSNMGWQLRIGAFKFPGCGGGAPDYSISCSPAALTAQQTQSANSTCTVGSLDGFSSAVNLDCIGLPSGASCNFAPNPVTPPANGNVNSNLTVSVLGGVPVGTYGFQARGTSGATVHAFDMTLTVTPAGGGTELLVNGGFEGNCNPWNQSGTGLTCQQGGPTPHGGAGYTQFAGNGNKGRLFQELFLPPTAPANLTFWVNIQSAETTTTAQNDRFFIEVRDTSNVLLGTIGTFSNLDESAGYVQKSFSLAAFRGQAIRLFFRHSNDGSLNTRFLLDDVSLK
jgi:hypothetical protein